MPAFEELRASCNELGIPEMLFQNSVKLYKQCMLKGLTQGRSRNDLVNACLLLICELFNYPLTINEVVKVSGSKRGVLLRYKVLIKRNITLPKRNVDTSYYITKFCYELGLKPDSASKAIRKLKEVEAKLVNKSNQRVAVTCIYLACSDQISIRALARITGNSISSIWKNIKECLNKG